MLSRAALGESAWEARKLAEQQRMENKGKGTDAYWQRKRHNSQKCVR